MNMWNRRMTATERRMEGYRMKYKPYLDIFRKHEFDFSDASDEYLLSCIRDFMEKRETFRTDSTHRQFSFHALHHFYDQLLLALHEEMTERGIEVNPADAPPQPVIE